MALSPDHGFGSGVYFDELRDNAWTKIMLDNYLRAIMESEGRPMRPRTKFTIRSINMIVEDCFRFTRGSLHLIQMAGKSITPRQTGHDLWFARNGIGAGFLDRPRLKEGIAEALNERARAMGALDVVEVGKLIVELRPVAVSRRAGMKPRRAKPQLRLVVSKP